MEILIKVDKKGGFTINCTEGMTPAQIVGIMEYAKHAIITAEKASEEAEEVQ